VATLGNDLAALPDSDAARPSLAKKLAEAEAAVKQWRKNHRWHLHQLRHTAATQIRKDFGLEASQAVLGHASVDATQIYAEKNTGIAKRVMQEVG
jgi:integrase